tara:strand:+ start:319 stop:474 length:156 start_codon:yes stop_codon:yes gene_type:complete
MPRLIFRSLVVATAANYFYPYVQNAAASAGLWAAAQAALGASVAAIWYITA